MRIYDLKQKEVINVKDCRRLGYVGDVDFDMKTGCMLALIVPGPGCICGFLDGRDMKETLSFAVAASALKHTIPGDFDLISREEAEELMTGGGLGRVKR